MISRFACSIMDSTIDHLVLVLTVLSSSDYCIFMDDVFSAGDLVAGADGLRCDNPGMCCL